MGIRNYKAVTVGQSLDDAATVVFDWTGGTLRPLAPISLRGSRDPDGNLLVEWIRRSRIGSGLRPSSDVPLGEETELFLVEVYSGSTLKRTARVPNLAQPVLWTELSAYASLVGRNGITNNQTVSGNSASATARQTLEVGLDTTPAFFEATLKGTTVGPSGNVYFLIPGLGKVGYRVVWAAGGSANQLLIYEKTRTEISESDSLIATESYTSGMRLRVQRQQDSIWFFKNPTSGSSPFFVRSGALNFAPSSEFTILTSLAGDAAPPSIEDCMVRRPRANFYYSKEMQIEDFGSTQSSVKVRVYQVSSTVGPGAYTEAMV